MKIEDLEYYRACAEREEHAATRADSQAIAMVHRELAAMYRQRLTLIEEGADATI